MKLIVEVEGDFKAIHMAKTKIESTLKTLRTYHQYAQDMEPLEFQQSLTIVLDPPTDEQIRNTIEHLNIPHRIEQ